MKKFLNLVVVMLVIILIIGVVFSLYKMIPSGGIVDTPVDTPIDNSGNTDVGTAVEEIIINIKNYIF